MSLIGPSRSRWNCSANRNLGGFWRSLRGAVHALHDGFTDLIYVLLPVWQI